LDSSLQAQAQTHLTKTADKMADHLGLRPTTNAELLERCIALQCETTRQLAEVAKKNPVTITDQMRELDERAKALRESYRKLTATLLESQNSMEVFNEQSRLMDKNFATCKLSYWRRRTRSKKASEIPHANNPTCQLFHPAILHSKER
jgi:uncharacterized small protein (DUF1192 family)